jgi:hypothetical protein
MGYYLSDPLLKLMVHRAIKNRHKFSLDYDARSWGVAALAKLPRLKESEDVARLKRYEDDGIMYAEHREG